jgi:hypothetical protein
MVYGGSESFGRQLVLGKKFENAAGREPLRA